MYPEVSVIICTHNPNLLILNRVIEALKRQSLAQSRWELIIIDNNSVHPVKDKINNSWHKQSSIISERQTGLSYARITGVLCAKSDLIIFVDDDNVLSEHFLQLAINHSKKHPGIGCFGGKSLPEFEEQPEAWFFTSGINLGCQDLGDQPYISNYQKSNFEINEYPAYAPIGTGMLIRKQAFLFYHREVKNSKIRLALGRKGKSLSSGEDNDIILTIINNGFEIAYFPDLIVIHLIPKIRHSLKYLKRMAFESNRSWVKVLHIHQINPWKPISKIGLPLRLVRAYWRCKPWVSESNEIKWKSVQGKLTGLSEL
ncbi:glycosyltransferase [Agrobacterium tumefaciens]|nr:glycosyltransferase [Agrobacterium tumefaciens]NTE18919.1 glycosyltransferase [Agrobacterium tumefaciens]